MFPSRHNTNLLIQTISQFTYDMNTTIMLPNLEHDHHPTTTTTTTNIVAPNNPMKLTAITKPATSKLKCVKKKRIVGKKDKQSKIHTAQGLRDRRMRLSVHTARKFFDLNDMLGFDKASKTIEWLFNKSHKAIKEIAENHQSDDHVVAAQMVNIENNHTGSPLSTCETESVMKIALAEDQDERSRKAIAVARTRTKIRDKIMIKNLDKKKKQLFDADPSVDIHLSQMGFSENRDDNNMKESSCYPVEYSNTYHFLKHLHLDNTVRNTDIYVGNITSIPSTNHSIFGYNNNNNNNIAEPPACWLNSRNPLLGFNNRIVPLNGNMNTENPSSGMISTNFMNFISENQEE